MIFGDFYPWYITLVVFDTNRPPFWPSKIRFRLPLGGYKLYTPYPKMRKHTYHQLFHCFSMTQNPPNKPQTEPLFFGFPPTNQRKVIYTPPRASIWLTVCADLRTWIEPLGWIVQGVRVLRRPRKPHKSKDWNFLHRNYTPIFFSTPINFFFELDQNGFLVFPNILGFSKGFLIKPL